jgi:hypothetical protein
MFPLYDSVLGCPCLASSKWLGAYPTQTKTVLVGDLRLRGWQSLSSFLVFRVVRADDLDQVLLITYSWLPELFLLCCKSSCYCIATAPPSTTTSVSCYSYFSRSWARVPRRQASCSSSDLLPVVSLISRLRVLSYSASTKWGLREVSVPADNNFTYYSSKANPSSFSNLAMFLSVYLLSPLLEGLRKK